MAKLTDNQKRCEDCPNLKIKNGQWTCEECFGQLVNEIDDCPEGVTLEQIEEINNTKIKISTGARAEKKEKTERKPRNVKVSDEKIALFSEIYLNLHEKFGENVQIEKENKLLTVKQGNRTFKIDIIERRKPKK